MLIDKPSDPLVERARDLLRRCEYDPGAVFQGTAPKRDAASTLVLSAIADCLAGISAAAKRETEAIEKVAAARESGEQERRKLESIFTLADALDNNGKTAERG